MLFKLSFKKINRQVLDMLYVFNICETINRVRPLYKGVTDMMPLCYTSGHNTLLLCNVYIKCIFNKHETVLKFLYGN